MCNAVSIIFKELYIKWLWFLGCRCKTMIYPGVFFLFFKHFDFLRQKLGKRHKFPKMTCNAIHIIFCKLDIMWLWFLVHWCKMMTSPGIFFIFEKFWFLGPKRVEKAKRGLNSLYWCVHHFLVTISHMSMIFGTLM